VLYSVRLYRTSRSTIPIPSISAVWDAYRKKSATAATTNVNPRAAALLTGPIRKPEVGAAPAAAGTAKPLAWRPQLPVSRGEEPEGGRQQPRPQPNALYLVAVFGHDEQSLREALLPYFTPRKLSFDVRWATDEDVVVQPSSREPGLSAVLGQLKQELVNASLRWCADVEEAVVDADSGTVTWREKWKTVGGGGRGGRGTAATAGGVGAMAAGSGATTPEGLADAFARQVRVRAEHP
jgi:hypothetical protein